MWRGSVTGGTNGVGLTWEGTSNQRDQWGGVDVGRAPVIRDTNAVGLTWGRDQ